MIPGGIGYTIGSSPESRRLKLTARGSVGGTYPERPRLKSADVADGTR